MTIRPTTYTDLDALMAIFAHARTQMAADGNPTQWGDGYPTREQLENDIQRGVSYVIEHKGVPCATFVFIIGEDPTYHYIEDGQWLDDTLPYGTIHRIASNGQLRGIFRTILDWCSAQCSNIRIDTHQANARMIHLIEQAQFTRCGIIYTRDNSPRMAYQCLGTAIVKD
ncbi:MAG: GNAT family N-acetyltransferase [Paludibacteraceae bacterium]|nr:GNAT family N-acetyltransferase [Paludibacteraceae bacterium]MBR2450724.1 GNAT family N-acetyltransferase [Paludibacteraceae bacterium]